MRSEYGPDIFERREQASAARRAQIERSRAIAEDIGLVDFTPEQAEHVARAGLLLRAGAPIAFVLALLSVGCEKGSSYNPVDSGPVATVAPRETVDPNETFNPTPLATETVVVVPTASETPSPTETEPATPVSTPTPEKTPKKTPTPTKTPEKSPTPENPAEQSPYKEILADFDKLIEDSKDPDKVTPGEPNLARFGEFQRDLLGMMDGVKAYAERGDEMNVFSELVMLATSTITYPDKRIPESYDEPPEHEFFRRKAEIFYKWMIGLDKYKKSTTLQQVLETRVQQDNFEWKEERLEQEPFKSWIAMFENAQGSFPGDKENALAGLKLSIITDNMYNYIINGSFNCNNPGLSEMVRIEVQEFYPILWGWLKPKLTKTNLDLALETIPPSCNLK